MAAGQPPEAQPAAVSGPELPDETTFRAFHTWLESWVSAGATARAQLVASGMQLAARRRAALAAKIRTDPAYVLARAIPEAARRELPAEVAAQLERPFSARGDFDVIQECGLRAGEERALVRRSVVLEGVRRTAAVFGRRLGLPTLVDGSFHGVILDDVVALAPSSLRLLEAAEISAGAVLQACPLGGAGAVIVRYGANEQVGLCRCHYPDPAAFAARVDAAEATAGRGVSLSDLLTGKPAVKAKPASLGPRRAIFLRVDFSDLPGTPRSYDEDITPSRLVASMHSAEGVASFFRRTTYGAVNYEVTESDVSPVLRLPRPAQAYASEEHGESHLYDDATTAARALGLNPDVYDHVAIVYSNLAGLPGSRTGYYAGLGSVGGRTIWLQGAYGAATISHEFGHNFTLPHANLWVTDGRSASGPGHTRDYGDPYDEMGGTGEFNPWFRSRAGWLGDEHVLRVEQPGVYRIFRFDGGSLQNGRPVALRVPGSALRTPERDTWIGLRMEPRPNTNVPGAGYVIWGYPLYRDSNLLDVNTPGNGAPADAGVEIGQVFHENGLAFRPLLRGGEAGAEYLDVQVLALGGQLNQTGGNAFRWRDVRQSVPRPAGFAEFALERLENLDSAVSLRVATENGTALGGRDFVAQDLTVSWPAGEAEARLIRVPLLPGGDALEFSVRAFPPAGAALRGDDRAVARLLTAGAIDSDFEAQSPRYVSDRSLSEQLVIGPDGSTLAMQATGSAFHNFNVLRFSSQAAPASASILCRFPFSYQRIPPFAVLDDGKMLVGAGDYDAIRTGVVRLLATGYIDYSFTCTGVLPTDEVSVIEPTADGRILLAGQFQAQAGLAQAKLRRLAAGGAVDAEFANLPQRVQISGTVRALRALPDGRMLVAGGFSTANESASGGQRWSLVRLLATGAVDPTFTVVRSSSEVACLLKNADGSLYVGGPFSGFNGTAYPALVRLTADGQVDPSFQSPIASGTVRSIAALGDGKILVGGSFTRRGGAGLEYLACFEPNGASANVLPPGLAQNTVTSVQVGTDGSITFRQLLVSGQPLVRRLRPLEVPAGGQFVLPTERGFARRGQEFETRVSRVGLPAGTAATSAQVGYVVESESGAPLGGLTENAGVLTWRAGEVDSRAVRFVVPAGQAESLIRVRLRNASAGARIGPVGSQWIDLDPPDRPVTLAEVTPIRGNLGRKLSAVCPLAPTEAQAIYRLDGLPPGLQFDPATGAISGVPLLAGKFTSLLVAENRFGKVTRQIVIEIAGAVAASRLINLSTRARAGLGDKVVIAGFVLDGPGTKRVAIRAMGPSLAAVLAGTLANPSVTVVDATGRILRTNADWRTTTEDLISAAGLAPGREQESAVVLDLPAGAYTAIVSGEQSGEGIGLVEVYDLQPDSPSPRLVNVSTRAEARGGDELVIGGLVVGGQSPRRLAIRAIGPSLERYGVAGCLPNPTIAIIDSSGAEVAGNDDWASHPSATALENAGLAPKHPLEAALVATLPAGSYTALVRGVGGGTGVALVEIYELP